MVEFDSQFSCFPSSFFLFGRVLASRFPRLG
jgi:hypothetical protein